MRYKDLNSYIEKAIRNVVKDELRKNITYTSTPLSIGIFADLDELAIITNGDITTDNLVNPLSLLTDGMIFNG